MLNQPLVCWIAEVEEIVELGSVRRIVAGFRKIAFTLIKQDNGAVRLCRS